LSGNKYYLRFDIDAMGKAEAMLAPFGRGDFFNLLDPIYSVRELMIMLYAGMNGHYGTWSNGSRVDKYSFEQIRDYLDKHMDYLRNQELDKDTLMKALFDLKMSVAEAARAAVGFTTTGETKKKKVNPGPTKAEETGGSEQA
jgi:hypothetical protein